MTYLIFCFLSVFLGYAVHLWFFQNTASLQKIFQNIYWRNLHISGPLQVKSMLFRALSSVVQVCLTLWPHGLRHMRLPCPSPTPRACSDSCLSSQWCYPTISSCIIPFFSCLQSFPASGSFLMSQFFASGSQSTGVSASASVLPMNIQDWFSLGLTSLGLIGSPCSPRDSQ